MTCLYCGTAGVCSCDDVYDLIVERYEMAKLIGLGPASFAGELLRTLRDAGVGWHKLPSIRASRPETPN